MAAPAVRRADFLMTLAYATDLATGHSRDFARAALQLWLYEARRIHRLTYFDENFLNLVPAAHVEGLYSCLDYYQNVSDPFSKNLINQYNRLYPGDAKFTAGSACTGLYRGLRLWEAAVKEAGSLKQDDVIKALDHAKIAGGPGGPAEMVPGQHHVRMNMYIAQASNGIFKIVKSLNTGNRRRGIGAENHCMHGKAAVVEEVLDWRPFDYFTVSSLLPIPGTPKIVMTRAVEDRPTAPRTWRCGSPIPNQRTKPSSIRLERSSRKTSTWLIGTRRWWPREFGKKPPKEKAYALLTLSWP